MQKTSRKRLAERSAGNGGGGQAKAAHLHAVHADSNLHLAPTLHLDPGASSLSNSSRGTHFTFGPVAGAAAVTALRLAHFETQAKIALLQLASLATITVGDQHRSGCSGGSSRLAALLPHHLTLLSLLNRQCVSSVGLNLNTNGKIYTRRQPYLSWAMYHHHSQQQGPQPFPSGARPAHHQPPPNHQQNRPASDILSQTMGFQFPRPTQLPDELESALAIRGARDMDHRSIEHVSLPSSHQSQSSASGIGQHGGYNSSPMTLTSDSQPSHQQGVDWSSYQPPTKLFATPTHSAGHQSSHNQQTQSTHAATALQNWGAPAKDLASPQTRHPHGGSGDAQGMYTPESAGSILASFGLSNEDLEVLSHYPDDQLTPDTLPFILRDIQINKTGSKKPLASSSASSFSRNIHDILMAPSRSSPLTRSRSPEVPSLLTVTHTAGKVIDYGHASRAKEDNSTRETFKREPLSSERTVKMYPSSSSVSSPKVDKSERQVRMEHLDSGRHGDRDYRRTSGDHRKHSLSNEREVPLSAKSRNLDRDYRNDGLKARPSSETRTKTSSRRSLSSSSGVKAHSTGKMLPTPAMISDFSAVSPKVYPHTCSLCHTQCDQEKDWVDHINTVNHTAACRDLRNKYPEWKPHPTSPPPSKYRVDPHGYKPHGRPYPPPPPHHTRSHHYAGGSSSHGALKRPYEEPSKRPASASAAKASQSAKHGPPQSGTKVLKGNAKPETKTVKTATSKNDTCAKPPPAKKKKKIVPPPSQDLSIAGRLVYLSGIPKNASEQDVTDLVGSFGKINNVILMPCSEEESQKGQGQKASVCMVMAEDAQALAKSTNLTIQDQHITTSIAKKCEVESSAVANRKSAVDSGGDAGTKTSDEKATLLITGLPEGGWSEGDVVKLVQPFGAPSDIVIAPSVRKVLLCVPDVETAQEMVKVHTFIPAKINDTELKITHVKQSVGIKTPVALYNLLMGTLDPLETPGPVGWSSLLVISNVPDTPWASSEVEKLVRRFGTVIKTLALNNMVICEMATAAMSMSVYKRFQKFPCILQSNPLFFSRKPDPKANAQAKVIAAYVDPAEETPTNGKESNAAGAQAEQGKAPPQDSSESPSEKMDQEQSQGQNLKASEQELAGAGAVALAENKSKDDKESLSAVSEAPATSGVDANQAPALDASSDAHATKAEAGNGTSPAGEDTSTQEVAPQLPKVTQEMVKALLVECRTRTGSNAPNADASDDGEPAQTPSTEAAQRKDADADAATAQETPGPEPEPEPDEEVKKQEKEAKEREAKKEKEARERERKEKERRSWEKEKREREERERRLRERDRRDWEKERIRRERDRRDRKRPHPQAQAQAQDDARASSCRSEAHRAPSGREQPLPTAATDHHHRTQQDEPEQEQEPEQEDCDDFPFNLSDFITVDEVGDVTDLPDSPSCVAMDATEDAPQEDACAGDAMEDTVEDATEEDAMEETVKDATVKDAMETSDAADVPDEVTAATSPAATEQAASPSGQTVTAPPAGGGAPASDLTTPAASSPAASPNAAAAAAASSEPGATQPEKSPPQSRTEGEQEKTGEEEESEAAKREESPSAGQQNAADELKGCEEEKRSVEEETASGKAASQSLPPFDPNSAVGMEFLVPKTGFFCKVCNRFFSGNKEAEVSHCRSFKHYDNLQKYLESSKAVNGNPKAQSS